MPSMRAVTPAVGTVLLVAVVVVVSASITVVAVDSSTQFTDPTPAVAFDSEVDGTVELTHTDGPTLDGEQLEVRGGEPNQLPSEIQAGDTVEVEPYGNESEITVVSTGERSSAPLTTVDLVESYQETTPTESESEQPPVGSCEFAYGQTVDGDGECVAVWGFTTDNVENASEVILLPHAEIETVSDTTDVWLKQNAQITDTVAVDNNIYLQDETAQITGTVESGTVIEEY